MMLARMMMVRMMMMMMMIIKVMVMVPQSHRSSKLEGSILGWKQQNRSSSMKLFRAELEVSNF